MIDPGSAFLAGPLGHHAGVHARSLELCGARAPARALNRPRCGRAASAALVLGVLHHLHPIRSRRKGRPSRSKVSKVGRRSDRTREAREAIRQCLRENRTVPVLQALPEDSLQQILDSMTRMELDPGTHIFRRGEPVNAVYVVESGELSVFKLLHEDDDEEIEATTLGPGSYIGELGLFYDRTCMESVCVRGEEPAAVWQLCRKDFFRILDKLAEMEEVCDVDPSIMDEEPAAIFAVSDGSGYSAGGAVSLALKQFEYRYRKDCQRVGTTTFPYIRYRAEILEITRRAREENALVVYTLMREEPREAIIEELQRPTKPGENEPLGLVEVCESSPPPPPPNSPPSSPPPPFGESITWHSLELSIRVCGCIPM